MKKSGKREKRGRPLGSCIYHRKHSNVMSRGDANLQQTDTRNDRPTLFPVSGQERIQVTGTGDSRGEMLIRVRLSTKKLIIIKPLR